jgi:hypothetical protein
MDARSSTSAFCGPQLSNKKNFTIEDVLVLFWEDVSNRSRQSSSYLINYHREFDHGRILWRDFRSSGMGGREEEVDPKPPPHSNNTTHIYATVG